MLLEQSHLEELKPYQDLLSKLNFDTRGSLYIDRQTREDLAIIYNEITDTDVCGSCSQDWIKRLSFWYFQTIQQLEKEQKPKVLKSKTSAKTKSKTSNKL